MSSSLGRNEPCHCGSKLKYKKCCLQKDEKRALLKERALAIKQRITRRDFISGPYIACPNCKLETFGVSIAAGGRNNSYSRECTECHYSRGYALPPVTKKVIYLDQFLISNMAKVLDVESSHHADAKKEPFWEAAYRKLARLSGLQLIVCPDSTFHEEESRLSLDPQFEVLRDVYEYFSHGATFFDHNTILRFQISRDFKAWLDGVLPVMLDRESVVHGELHEWQGGLQIGVHFKERPEEVAQSRASRAKVHAELVRLFEDWQKTKKPFAQSLDEEARAFGKMTLQVYIGHLKKQAAAPAKYAEQFAKTGKIDMDLNDILPPPSAEIVQGLLSELSSRGIVGLDAIKKVTEYLYSDAVQEVPFVRLQSLLFAALNRKAATGQKRVPSAGTFTDVNAIASILPYCDAIFLDKEMVGLLHDEPLKSEVAKYDTKVFSLANKDEFLAYLGEIENTQSPEHKAAIADLYGEEGRQPWMELVASRKKDREEEKLTSLD